jgi:hypothetical protein
MPRAAALLLAAAFASVTLLPARAEALTHPRDLASTALHPWRLHTRSYAPLWPLRDPALCDRSFARLQSAGVRRARVDMKWSSVEPHGPLIQDWGEFDTIAKSARRHHVQLEPIVAFTPSWANRGAGPFAFPSDPSRFEDFLVRAMRRYPDVPVWEIWNEPNSRLFSPPRPDADRFVALLRAASRARSRAGSHAKLITGGLTPGVDVGMPEFAEQIAHRGAFHYADALGVHPYSRKQPEESGSSFLELPRLHARVSRAAGRPVDLWVTEYGYPNATRASSYGPPAGEKEQALRLQKAFALAVGWPWLKRLTWYGFRDDCSDSRLADCRFGLLRQDFSPKRAWYGLGQVLAGNLPMLDTRIGLHRKSKLVGRRKRRRRLHTLYGRLIMPGTDPARGSVRVTAKRSYHRRRRTRRIRTTLRDGRFRLSLSRLRPGRWRFRASFKGDSRYSPSRSRRLSLRVRRRR